MADRLPLTFATPGLSRNWEQSLTTAPAAAETGFAGASAWVSASDVRLSRLLAVSDSSPPYDVCMRLVAKLGVILLLGVFIASCGGDDKKGNGILGGGMS